MDDEEFYAQSPKDRNYSQHLFSQIMPDWYFSRGTRGANGLTRLFVVACLAILYPFWVILILALTAGYCVLALLFLPVRTWAKKSKKGYYAATSGGDLSH